MTHYEIGHYMERVSALRADLARERQLRQQAEAELERVTADWKREMAKAVKMERECQLCKQLRIELERVTADWYGEELEQWGWSRR